MPSNKYTYHCVKGVQIRSFFWSVFGHFSRIATHDFWDILIDYCIRISQRFIQSPSNIKVIYLFHATDLFQYPVKTSESQRLSNVFSGYRLKFGQNKGQKTGHHKVKLSRLNGRASFLIKLQASGLQLQLY